jgi:hypothetical protein
MLQDSFSTAVPRHPDALMRSALTADASLHICGVRAVLEVVAGGLPSRRTPTSPTAPDRSLSVPTLAEKLGRGLGPLS